MVEKIKVNDKVIDNNGYTGKVNHIFRTGQVQVQQKPNVICTYDHMSQLRKVK